MQPVAIWRITTISLSGKTPFVGQGPKFAVIVSHCVV